jgi:hypothetical protein
LTRLVRPSAHDGHELAGVGGDTLRSMDALRRADVEQARATSPEEKGRQAFDAMRTGIRLKRAALRARSRGFARGDRAAAAALARAR